jgi:predicted O-linked N-acetylglucosamine transferase (SPINDLY family)
MTTLREEVEVAAGHYTAGRIDEAVAAYRRALLFAPRHAAVHHNLGVALAASGRADEAASSLREAASLDPASAAPWLALGHLEFGRDRLEAAETAFGEAARLAPRSVEAHYNLGYTRHELWRWVEAVPPLEVARALDPASEKVWYQLYNTQLALGRREQALADFLAFEANASVTPILLRAALESVRSLGDSAREAMYLRQVLEYDYGPDDLRTLAGFLMRLQYFDIARTDLKRLYDTYNRLMQQRVAGVGPLARAARLPGRVRIGYLSADFRQHVMGRLMFDVIGAHDRNRHAIHLYSLADGTAADALTARFRALADRFVLLPPRHDADAARAIAADDCDVLVDLMGHTMFSRPEILAYKPARTIVTHLGSHGALGLAQVDFKLTDRHADVVDASDFQIERPLPMASCVLPFRRAPRVAIAPPARVSLGIAADALVLGEFVTVQKLSPRCLGLWREILGRVPGAVLLFSPSGEGEHAGFRRQLAGFGIDPARAAFVPRGHDEASALARYALVDLVLDTLPYTGGDTTLAALDAGIPVVTLVGPRHAERMGASIMRHLGLPELVTVTEAAYVDLAIALASDPARRARVAARVTEKFAAAAATYPVRYTRDLEAALAAAIAARQPIPD